MFTEQELKELWGDMLVDELAWDTKRDILVHGIFYGSASTNTEYPVNSQSQSSQSTTARSPGDAV